MITIRGIISMTLRPEQLRVNLTDLRHGDRAVITSIAADDPVLAARFAARGIVPGTAIGVLRAGNPLLIGIDNDRWAINRHEAEHIHVTRVEQPRRSLLALLRGA